MNRHSNQHQNTENPIRTLNTSDTHDTNISQSMGNELELANLRIAVVSDAISGRNGVGTFYQDLLAQIDQRVGKVSLISPTDTRHDTLERFALPMPGDKTQRLAWPSTKVLFARLDKMKPNLIVVPSLGPFTYFAVSYARKNKIPLLVVNHTDFDHLLSIYWPKQLTWAPRWVLDKVNRRLYKRAVAVGVMHDEAAESARQLGAGDVRVMATPLSQLFLSEPIKPPSDGATRAIFVGRLAKEKGITHLLDAVGNAPQTHFTIVGDGPLRNDVENAANKNANLTYLGWLPRSGVLTEMDAADILILPSAYETFGTVALEALARERFVIASSGCGITNWLALAEGLFLTSEDRNLSQVLRDVQDMPKADRLEKASKSWRAVQDFNNQAVNDWLELFREAAEEPNR